ncbi:RNA polymerase sigma-70 factor [Dyadobacter sp. MSC1_007]|jgi:RNA polymerase sigma-70 factor (family 1)|uniref:RNA polymerase sigma-70 factor n=1 Tax=Dyadobacter sp. MSC1_007 TaxID=2909264 RepID=UPI00202F5D15|nr:RNA polymerase sigma-70 factor [Dyadobacter sp. MSC1_007]
MTDNLPQNTSREDDEPHKVLDLASRSVQTDGPIDSEWMIRNGFEKSPKHGFELLFKRYHKVLCSHAARFVYSEAVAQDIVSEVFCKLWKSRSYENITSSYRFYLFRSVRNEAYNYIRLEFQPMEQLEAAAGHLSGNGQLPDMITQYEEILHHVEQLVQNLPPQCRKIFLMSRFEEKRYQEIADELGISIKTVEVHISRALLSLRHGLKEHWI